MKKYLLLFSSIIVFVLLGGIFGSIYSGITISNAIPWTVSWLIYLWFIHIPIIIIFYFVSIGLYILAKKILKKVSNVKIFVTILIIDAVIPFLFYFYLFAQGVKGRF